jgi:hypothetical protein
MIPEILDVTRYKRAYNLNAGIIGITKIDGFLLDLNEPGLILHGSEADPYSILKYGLIPHQNTKNSVDKDMIVCLGLNSKNPNLTLKNGLARKNSAVKYAGYFSPKGAAYVISEEVKKLKGYREFWDMGDEARGYAWVTQPIKPELITAVVTEDVTHAAAAIIATESIKPIYKPDGNGYLPQPL